MRFLLLYGIVLCDKYNVQWCRHFCDCMVSFYSVLSDHRRLWLHAIALKCGLPEVL